MQYIGLHQPDPDFNRLLRVLLRQGEPDRVPFFELFADPEIVSAVVGREVPRLSGPDPISGNRQLQGYFCDCLIEFSYTLGYDYVVSLIGGGPNLDYGFSPAEDTAALSRGQRQWARESHGLIGGWEDYEKYPWPSSGDADYWMVDYLAAHVPEGMKFVGHGGAILEHVTWLMGYQNLAIALYDQPDLLQTMFDRVGQMVLKNCETMCQYEAVGALWISDDIGHRSGPMIGPEHLRRYVFPWWKRMAETAHRAGRPVLLHSCGNLAVVMDDIIDDVKIDAKHSFEDTYLPVTEAKRQYGHRIALLGGVDVDVLCRSTEEEVRRYVGNVIDICGPGGGYALGTGNTVANYVPIRNYLAMLDEGRRCGIYPLRG